MMTEKDTTYQGWTNHATWCVKLHADNHEPWCQRLRIRTLEIIENAPKATQVRDGIWTVTETERFYMAETLKDWAESNLCIGCGKDDPASLFQEDMLAGYLDSVNWDELAIAFLAKARE